jgi:3-phosphoshikimate 1-carboxyvinyltransferase
MRETESQRGALRAAEDALLLDNSNLSIEASVLQVLDWWQQRRPFGRH